MNFLKGVLVLLLATVLSCGKQRSPMQSTAVTEEEMTARRTHELVNAHRSALRLPPLLWNETVAEQAVKHSRDMASGRVPLGHEGFEERFRAISTVLSVQAGGENAAYNYGFNDPSQAAVNGWLNSPGHRANIEGEYTLTGLGCARDAKGGWYFTQIFILTFKSVALEH
ncbi:MAG: CAP domain-containing protein [candidate division KSB1 bacterium]|nr:CAP domain-containing protein [candidate division KSB1 bacterium]